MKKTKLNGSVLEMKLNADNRRAFTNVILTDAFKKRSDAIRVETATLIRKMAALTWGKTPQASSANKRAAEKIISDCKKLESKGLRANAGVGKTDYDLRVNIGGLRQDVYFNKPDGSAVVNFESEFMCYRNDPDYLSLGASSITLTTDHALAKQFSKLKDEGEAIAEAADELTAILGTIFGKSRTLGAAVEKWPELSGYAPSILSACKELTVRPIDLNAKIDALRSGSGSVVQAMKETAKKK